jgi:predicted dehydrogenase
MAKKYKNASDIKVGVVGYGGAFNMGRAHLSQMKDAGMTPYAVAELDASRLKVAETDFPGIGTFATVDEMLKKSDVDLVTIITPHNTHAPLAIKCLKAGRHVVTEKPFAITTAECDAMIKAAKTGKAMLSTYHNRHWDGCVLSALKAVQAGKVGDIVRIEAHMGGFGMPGDWWRTSKTISGGVLYDWGAHLLEYSLQLLGDAKLKEVSGFAHNGLWSSKSKWKKDTNEDEATAIARFDTGAFINLRITNMDANPRPRVLDITGTKGSYTFDHGSYELTTISPKGLTTVERGPNVPGEGQKFYDNISAHLTKGEKLVITAEWARRPIHILDLADQSAKKGMSIKAKYA